MRLFNQNSPEKTMPATAQPQARPCRKDATRSQREAWLSCPCCPSFLKVSSRLPSPLLARHPPLKDQAPSCSSSSLQLPLELPRPKHQTHRDQTPPRCALGASRKHHRRCLGHTWVTKHPHTPPETGQHNKAAYTLLFKGARNKKIMQ